MWLKLCMNSLQKFFKKFKVPSFFFILIRCPNCFSLHQKKKVSKAYSKHSKEDTCTYKIKFSFDSQFHYHILIEIEKFSAEDQKLLTSYLFNVPFLFTCFKELISNVKNYVAVGPIMDKLTAAILYNNHHSLETPCRRFRKKLSQVCV